MTATAEPPVVAEPSAGQKSRRASMFSRDLVVAGDPGLVPEARPAAAAEQPGHVHRRARQRDHDRDLLQGRRAGERRAALVRRRDRDLALAHRAVRELRRGDRRGPRQGAGERAARDADDDHGAAPLPRRPPRGDRRARSAEGRRRRGRGGDDHPRGRRHRRGRRLGRRVGDHRRVRARHPRGRRRPLGRHRRHEAPLRPARDRGHPGAGAVVPRPHDRARRGRGAAEDAERDRPQHPPRRPDDHVRRRGRHADARTGSTPARSSRRPS